MALFGGNTTTVTTPDGRTLVLPAEVAAQFSGLQPAGPPVQDLAQTPGAPAGLPPTGPGPAPAPQAAPPLPTGGAPQWTPADTAALGAETPPADASAAPVTNPNQVPTGGPPRAPRGPVTEPGPEQGTQPVAPAPPMTNAQLVKEGPAGTLAAQDRAAQAEKAAVAASAQVEADKATKEGQLLAARDAQTQQILEQRQRQEAENKAALDAKMAARDEYAAKIANTKIDRSIDHPVWAAIGLALGTIGGAMQQKAYGGAFHNIAFDTLMQGIDRKVDAQMKDLENQRAALGQMNAGIAEQRQYGMDRLGEIDARKDAALQQAKQTVETMATQFKSPEALANAQVLNSKIDEERAKLRGEAADRAQAQVNTEAARKQAMQIAGMQNETTRRGQNIQYQIHQETLQAQREEKMAEVSARLLAEGKKEAAAKADKLAQTALYDPRSRDVLLNPAGQKKFADADKLEAEARQRKDPAEAQALRQQALDLRDSARLNDGVHAPDPKVAEQLKPKIGAAQSITDQIGDIQEMLKGDPATWDREKWAGLATKLGNVANVYQKVIGERISVRAFDQTMKHILEFDPDSLFDRTASKDRALESLKQLKGIVADDINAELGQHGIKTDWKPMAKGEDATTFNLPDKTAYEVGQAENPNLLQRAGARIITGGTKSYDDFGFQERAQAAAESQPGSEGGLSPTATAAVKGLALKADRAGDAERAKIVTAIASTVEAGGTDAGRASLANGVLSVLKTSSPLLYKEVVAQLPKDQAEAIVRADAAKASLTPNLPPPTRTPSGFDPDKAAADTAAAVAEARRQERAPEIAADKRRMERERDAELTRRANIGASRVIGSFKEQR